MTEATLVVSTFTSSCSACGKNAFPDETTHETVKYAVPERTFTHEGRTTTLPAQEGEAGCGATFTSITTCYMGEAMANATKRLRPDLPFIGVDAPFLGG